MHVSMYLCMYMYFISSVTKIAISGACSEQGSCADVNAVCRGGFCVCNGDFDVVYGRCGTYTT